MHSPTPTIYRSQSAMYRERGTVPVELVNAVLEKGDAFEVTFDGPDDPRNPQNWRYIAIKLGSRPLQLDLEYTR